MADYSHLANPDLEWVEFEKSYKSFVAPEGISVQESKTLFNEGRAKLFQSVLGSIDEVASEEVSIPGSNGRRIAARLYYPKTGQITALPLYIHLHGGGFHYGDLDTEDVGCRLICRETSFIVLNVNYCHSPEWTFPAPIQDAWDTFIWAIYPDNIHDCDLDRIFIGGTSAGASLACATVLREREQHGAKIKGLILTLPPTVHEDVFPTHLIKDGCNSLEQNSEAPILPLARLRKFHEMYKPDPLNRFFSPLLADDDTFRQFPRTSIHVAGMDPLRDEGLLFAEKLKRAGVDTRLRVFPGLPHAFMNLPELQASKKWRNYLYEDIRWLMAGLA